jgi:hypothetical protein
VRQKVKWDVTKKVISYYNSNEKINSHFGLIREEKFFEISNCLPAPCTGMASSGSSILNLNKIYLIDIKMGPLRAPTTTAPQAGYTSHPAQSATVPAK